VQLARLVGTAAPDHSRLLEREGRDHGARVAVGVAVVKVVDRERAVVEHDLLDEPHPEGVDVEVDVLLRAGDGERRVVAAGDVGHGFPCGCRSGGCAGNIVPREVSHKAERRALI
jgi:hypothetical protein